MKPTTNDEQLLILVNTPQWGAFMEYKQKELDAVHKELEWASKRSVLKAQGRAVEIRKDLELKDKLRYKFDNGDLL